jgi:hypothetical protein
MGDQDVLATIGADAGMQQCRATGLVNTCATELAGHRCQTSLGAERDEEFRSSRTPEQILAKYDGEPWVDACDCYVQCALSADCEAFDNFNGACRLFSACGVEAGTAVPAQESAVWFVSAFAATIIAGGASDDDVSSVLVCSGGGFTEQYFLMDVLMLALALSAVTNLAIEFLGRGFGAGTAGLDEHSWLATHWLRMLARDAVPWDNPRTFNVHGKIARAQADLQKEIKPRDPGCLQRLAAKCVRACVRVRMCGAGLRRCVYVCVCACVTVPSCVRVFP